MNEPTSEQCSQNAIVGRDEHAIHVACWYPQMGGYVGKCVVRVIPGPARGDGGGDDCFDVFVWHDGEFPFDGGPARELHHCDPEQFIRFGELVRRLGCVGHGLRAGSPIEPGDRITITPEGVAHAVPRRHVQKWNGSLMVCTNCGSWGSDPCPGLAPSAGAAGSEGEGA